MPTHNTYIYILIMALVTYLVRVLPLTLIRKDHFFTMCLM